jgi:hypothetical protein
MISVCTSAKFTRGDKVHTSDKFLSNILDVGTMLNPYPANVENNLSS